MSTTMNHKLSICTECDGYGFMWLTPPDGRKPDSIKAEDKSRWIKCMKCNPLGKTPSFIEAATGP